VKRALVIALAFFTSLPALGQEKPLVQVSGYVQPAFGAKVRSLAVPRDRVEYGALVSRAGVIFSGERFKAWRYVVHLVLDGNAFNVLTGVSVVDTNGDGAPEGVDASRRSVTATILENVSITYQPHDLVSFTAGQTRIPFTIAQRSANSVLMFPTRAAPNEVFLSGSDRGALASLHLYDRALVSLGAFSGGSLGLSPDAASARGLVYSLRADVEPIGRMASAEGDYARGPLRFGAGFGALYRAADVFDASGYEAASFRDLRMSVSLRASVRGFYAQAEYLRRQRTDNLSARPQTATGAYGQASFYFPVAPSVALAPIARVGYSVVDETFAPRRTLSFDAGLSIFPAADAPEPDALRVLVQYVGERRSTEGEDAHGALVQLQYRF
jgi:hypothetical protein